MQKKYPTIVKDIEYYSFLVPRGWQKLVDDLTFKINSLLREAERKNGERVYFKLYQVKEKFGGLRYYYTSKCSYEYQKLIKQEVISAGNKSYKTCEECGDIGARKYSTYIITICDKCDKLFNKETQ